MPQEVTLTRPCYPAIRFFTLAVLLTCTLIGSSALGQTGGFTLPSGCTLPFDNIATKPDPFKKCGNCGVVSKTAKGAELQAKALQSQAKNDFCADTSQITVVDFATLRQMGAIAQQKSWQVKDITNRQELHGFFPVNGRSIGEGDVVRLKAWILAAHVSDCAAGEEVNCGTPGFVNNDLHIPLVDPSAGGQKQGECTSVTSEISPHFRPATWSNLDLKTPVKNVVRVTGPLFYDNAHDPCATPQSTKAPTGDPARSTLWEIHPVYQLEVCANTDASQCDVTSADSTMWIAYDQWIKDPSNQQATEAKGKTDRDESSCAHPKPPAAGSVPAQCPAGSAPSPSHRKKKSTS